MRIRQGVLMWLAGMIGVLFMLFMIPAMLIDKPLSIPLWQVLLMQLLQSSIILAVAVWLGMVLSSKVNLHAPCFEAIAKQQKFAKCLHPQLIPGGIAGILVGLFLIGISYATPQALITKAPQFNPIFQILAEVFYGGITEEILLRWGVMTLVLWLLWRFIQRNPNNPSQLIVWLSIVISALLFGIAHLPAAHAIAGHLTMPLITYIIIGNTLAGMVFGFLYQRYGLESAMIAHVSAHLVKDVIGIF